MAQVKIYSLQALTRITFQYMNLRLLLITSFAFASTVMGQTKPATTQSISLPLPPLPGKGLAQHDFFYAGEAKDRKMYIVRNGHVVWSYDDPQGKGEISDAVLLSNGDVVLAHQFAVRKFSADKKVLWNFNAPKGTEIHTAVPIGNHHVLFVQNGNPATVNLADLITGEFKQLFTLPTAHPSKVHGQFRHARITPAGTLLVAHMDSDKVVEYRADGKALRTIAAPGAWGATPLPDGNMLIVDRDGVREIDAKGEATWTLKRSDIPEYGLKNLQLAWRLSNGNTLLNNWVNQWDGPIDKSTAPVQALEVSPDKKVVWALRSWENPDLGPATTIQLLHEPTSPENVTFAGITD